MDARRLQNLIQQSIRRAERIQKFVSRLSSGDSRSDLLAGVERIRVIFNDTMLFPENFNSLQLDNLQDELQELRRMSNVVLRHDSGQLRENFDEAWRGLWNLSLGMRIGLNSDRSSEIASLIPDQKIAPFGFGFNQSRLVVLEEFSTNRAEIQDRVDSARDELIEQSLELMADVANSNSGPRLLRQLQSVHSRLDERKPVVQLGMATRSLVAVTQGKRDELPTDLFSLLLAHAQNVFSYLAQFPDWQDFVQQSLAANMSPNETETLISSARALADFFEHHADYATADVPQALRTTAAWTEDLEKPDGRMIYALGRTIENLLALISRTVLEIAEEARKQAVKLIAKGVVGFIAASCAGLIYTMAGLPGAEWIAGTFDALVAAAAR
jgi:hypothetical protein